MYNFYFNSKHKTTNNSLTPQKTLNVYAHMANKNVRNEEVSLGGPDIHDILTLLQPDVLLLSIITMLHMYIISFETYTIQRFICRVQNISWGRKKYMDSVYSRNILYNYNNLICYDRLLWTIIGKIAFYFKDFQYPSHSN